MASVWTRLAILLVAAGFSASLYAQGGIRSTKGNLYGQVKDESGGVLPGVTVTLSGVGAPVNVTSDSQGNFRFVNIDPGTYSVRADLAGFASVEQRNVIVSTAGNTETIILMQVSSVATAVTVTGEPLLDTRKERTGTTFSTEALRDIPSSRDPWGMLQISPGILTDNVITGANNNGQQSVFIGKGANFTNNAWNMDGISVTDLGSVGQSPAYYDFEAFQEMQFTTGGSDPSVVVAGVTVNFLTKRGTNTPHGSGRIFVTPNQTEAYNTNPEIAAEGLVAPRINNIEDYGAEVGGAAWKDRIWLWGSYGEANIRKFKSNGLPNDTVLDNYTAKVNGQAIESNALTAFYFYSAKSKVGFSPGAPSQFPFGTNWFQDFTSHSEKIEDSQVFGSSLFATVFYSFQDSSNGLTPEGGLNAEVYRDASRVWHNSYTVSRYHSPQHAVQGSGSYFFTTGTFGHEVKFGGTYILQTGKQSSFWPGDEVYTDQLPIDGHDPAYPYTAHITRAAKAGQNVTSIGGYVGDTITSGDLTMNLGVRNDTFYGQNAPSAAAANPAFPDILPALIYSGGRSDFHSSRWLPRVGITYALGAQKTTLLRASFSQFADQLGTTQVLANNPLGGIADAQYQWNGHYSGGDHIITAADICLTCPVVPIGYDPNNPGGVGVSPNTIDPNLKAPLTTEITGGVEHQFLPGLVAGLTYTYRQRKDFIWQCPQALTNSNACITSADYALFASGVTGYDHNGDPVQTGPVFWAPNLPASYTYGTFETNRPDYSTTYNGLELQVTKRLADKWMMQGSFTWSNWKQNVSNVARGCIDPTNQVGYLTFGNYLSGNTCANDIAYDFYGSTWINADWAFAVSGLYELPWNFKISGSIFGHQGYPTPYFVQAAPPDGLGIRYVAAGSAAAHRLGSVYEVDLSIQKVIPIGGLADITLSINMFNAFNTRTIVLRDSDATDSGSIPPTGIAGFAESQQNPRVLSFGARVSF